MGRIKCLGNRIKTVGNHIIEETESVYGYLYNWYVVEGQISSSDDWFIPNSAQFTGFGFPYAPEGKDLKSRRQVNSPLGGEFATNEHPRWNEDETSFGVDSWGFDALPGGQRLWSFVYLGERCDFWTSTNISGNIQTRRLRHNSDIWWGSVGTEYYGAAIRLCRNATEEELLLTDGTYCGYYIGNDLKKYRTVKIGLYIWITANLAETKFRNGDLIPFEATPGQGNYSNAEWATLTTPARCAYQNNEAYAIKKVPVTLPLKAKYV